MKPYNFKVAPVKKYNKPKYPTKTEALASPGLLRKLPRRWQKNAAVAAAAGLFGALTISSCGIFDSSSPGAAADGYNPDSENYLNVAPVFAYGEGTGSMGCVMVAPPVFLSEAEALAIIKNTAEAEGLSFGSEPPGYTAEKNKIETKYSWDWESKFVLGKGNVGLDLYDAKKKVAVSFISMREAEQIYPNGPWSSVTGYMPRRLAELTVEDFAEQRGDIAVGVFYDPGKDWESEEHQRIFDEFMSNSEKEWEERREQYEIEVKALAEENLRAQVRDFIEWLQGQGII